MSAKNDELTPMMRQYKIIKEEHQDKVLFFRLGDFYEMFSDDAIEVSRLLNLTLTHRGAFPMCGIPYHAAKSYIKRLLDVGKKVAICEQTDLVDDPRKLCERKVIAIYTPATVVEDDFLSSFENSYILSLFQDKSGLYISYSDITDASFKVSHLPLDRTYSLFLDQIIRINPKEILIEDDLYYGEKKLREIIDNSEAMVTRLPSFYFSQKDGYRELCAQFSATILSSRNIGEKDPVVRSSGALLRYMKEMRKEELPQLKIIEWDRGDDHLFLTSATIKSLELVRNQSDGREHMTLFSAINRTKTSSGARRLKEEILSPLANVEMIRKRLDWVERFYSNPKELESIRLALSSMFDIERISVRMEMEKTQPKDLIAFSDSIFALIGLVEEKNDLLSLSSDVNLDDLVQFSLDIEKGINRECTNLQNEGTIILRGYDEEYDKNLSLLSESAALFEEYLEKVKTESGIQSIKIGENRIIGHFLEVSKRESVKVPEYFIRRQTLVSGERYTTEELSALEERINDAKEKTFKLEKKIYRSFVERARDLSNDIRAVGKLISTLDFFSSLSFLAREKSYIRPEISSDGEMEIVSGRHPVVESYMNRSDYVPNSFSSRNGRFALITGPNMAGKSTYLREIALIAIMMQIGSFVPAEKAVLPVFDKVFSRVGASDNLARGESTFLVEMSESAEILRSMTRSSLVIMDEIGRGTSTEDGLALAYAIMNYLKKIGAISLFSTHYHELTGLDPTGIQLLTMKVDEEKGGVRFLRKAVPGIATSSYGIHVAKIAGLPREVIRDASSFQKRHFPSFDSLSSGQGNLFQEEEKEDDYKDIADEITAYDIENSTPMDALMFLLELKKRLN